jgi:vacuolar-type H+-ATPase subunit I/STV1
MSALKENLEALSASLPDVPAELEALKTQAGRVERGVVDFLNEVAGKDAEAATRLDELKQALVALGHESEGERTQLESQMDSFEERLEAGLGELRDDQGRLANVVEGAGTAAADLKDVLDETSESARAGEREAVQELGDLAAAAGSVEEGLRAALEAATSEADALRGAVEETSDGVKQALSSLLQQMRAVAEQAKARIDQTAERLAVLQAAHEAEVPEQRARLVEQQQEIVTHLRERIDTELKTRIDEGAEAVLAALSLLRDEGLQAAETCKDARDTLEAGFEALREATRPLPPAIEAAKQAAVQVGLNWA